MNATMQPLFPTMNVAMRPLLLSLKPRYADLVFEGLKTAELRRRIASHMRIARYLFTFPVLLWNFAVVSVLDRYGMESRGNLAHGVQTRSRG